MLIDYIKWPADHQACRLFHGRGYQVPTLNFVNVDWLSPVALIVLYKEVERDWLEELACQLKAKLGERCESVQVQYRCRPLAPYELLLGNETRDLVASEHGLKYQLTLGKNQNYGLFLDMANGRDWVQQRAAGKKVLNLFAYTCGFSVAAIAGGAESVVNLDLSKASLATGRDNHRLNQHDLSKVKYLGHDLFKSWGKLRKFGPYDIIIADPPSLQKGSVNIKRDYPKIMRRLPELLAPNGLALLCLNAPELDFKFLKQAMILECPQAKRVEQIDPPTVFMNAETDRGLKCLVYQLES